MKEVIDELKELITYGSSHVLALDSNCMTEKPSENQWSKIEIFGHLIDSAQYNLRRFLEIQFEKKPYQIVSYNQDKVVKVNDYQNADIEELLGLWTSLNKRIALIMETQSTETLAYEITFGDGTTSDLRFLMTDYVSHMAHHLTQITDQV